MKMQSNWTFVYHCSVHVMSSKHLAVLPFLSLNTISHHSVVNPVSVQYWGLQASTRSHGIDFDQRGDPMLVRG